MTDDLDVGISVRVVPDGLDRTTQKLKLSLVLRPDPNTANGGTTVHLRSWPTDIEAALQAAMRPPSTPSVVIQLSIDGSATPLSNIVLTGDTLRSALKSSPSSPKATNLWQRIFTYPHTDQIEDLRWVLSNPSSRSPDIRAESPVVASRSAVLATALEQLRARHTASHLAILELLDTNPEEAKALQLSLRTEREVSLDYLQSKAFTMFGTFQPATSLDQIHPTTTAMEGIKADFEPNHAPSWYHGSTALQWRQEAEKAAIAARLVRTRNQNGVRALRGGDIGNTIRDALKNIDDLLSGDAQKLEIFSAFSRGVATPPDDESKYLQYGAEHALSNLPDKKFPLFSSSSRNSARRKFFGITQRPSLATFLGLILDFELPLAQFPQPSGTTPITGTISAWIGNLSSPPVLIVPTAFRLSMSVAGSTTPTHDYFGPISKYAQTDNFVSPGQVHVDDGLVNLNVMTRDSATYRYVMLSCDAQAGAISTEGSASAALSQDRQGIAQDQITTKLQTLRTRGIAIIDMLQAESTSRDLQNLAAAGDNPPSTLYAEDLLMGYRLDVGIYEGGRDVVWRSTAERAVAYDDPLMIPARGHRWTGPFPERDDAFFRPLARVAQQNTPDPSVAGQPQVVAYETMVTWRGASLAFPTPTDDAPQNTPHKPDDDLAVDSVISPAWPNSSGTGRQSVGLPALRFLDRIATSLRCVWLNGGGLNLPEANLRRQDTSNKLWLDRGLDQITVPPVVPPSAAITPAPKGFKFRRYEEAPAPTWHLHPDDRITRLSTKELAKFPGDQIDRLILRAPVNSQWGRPRRWLLPAHASFDLAELHGVFDKAPELENTPGGAFKYIKRNAQGFPEAVDGAVVYLDPTDKTKQTQSRGTVLESGIPTRDTQPYYPDPLAETLYAAFRRGDTTPNGYRNIWASWAFNPRALWPKSATPVLIELVPIGDPAHDRGAISVTSGTDQGRSLGSAPKITVGLAPGEEVDLLLWCAPASAATLAEHWVIPSAVAFVKSAFPADVPAVFQAAQSVMSEAIDRGLTRDSETPSILSSGSPTPNLSATRRLRLVYPVEKPLLVPAFGEFAMIRVVDSLSRSPQTTTQVNPDPAQHLKDVWQNFIDHMGPKPQSKWTSEPAATRAFFVGDLVIEKASTSSVVCEARWFDCVDDATTIKKVNGAYEFSPPPDEKLAWRSPPQFKISNTVVEPGGAGSPISLLRDESRALRALNFDFGDTKARQLTLRLVAHSRFDKYFSRDGAGASGEGRFDSASETKIYWLPSTAKPAAPLLLPTIEALPVFSFATKLLDKGFIIERVCSVQVKIPIPSWWSAGEGELLALVFGPNGLFVDNVQEQRKKVSELGRADPNQVFAPPAGDYLTRRGHDPIRRSGHLGPFITKEDLIDKSGLAKGAPVRYRDDLSMTVTPDDQRWLVSSHSQLTSTLVSNTPAKTQVSIAAYMPTVDEETGTTRNCLIRIDPGQSFWPFVRLVLARYQPHSIPEMELSSPVVTWAKIGPRRTASIEFLDARRTNLKLTVEGQGFHLANPGPGPLFQPPLQDLRADVDRPYLDISLVRANRRSETGSWLPVIQNGRKLEWLGERADYDFEGYVRWIKTIQLPTPSTEERYGIIVKEYSRMTSDELSGDNANKGSVLMDGHVLYAAVLDLSDGSGHVPSSIRQ